MTLAVAKAARLGVGLGAVCADVVESLNAILKRPYNDHTARAGGGGCRGLRDWNVRRGWCCKRRSGGFGNLTFCYNTMGHHIRPHALWPNSWPSKVPCPLPSRPHP